MEFDARGGPVRDTVARLFLLWRRRLAQEVRTAVGQGELPPDTDPEQVGFEVVGIYLAADPSAADRARRALDRILAPTDASGRG